MLKPTKNNTKQTVITPQAIVDGIANIFDSIANQEVNQIKNKSLMVHEKIESYVKKLKGNDIALDKLMPIFTSFVFLSIIAKQKIRKQSSQKSEDFFTKYTKVGRFFEAQSGHAGNTDEVKKRMTNYFAAISFNLDSKLKNHIHPLKIIQQFTNFCDMLETGKYNKQAIIDFFKILSDSEVEYGEEGIKDFSRLLVVNLVSNYKEKVDDKLIENLYVVEGRINKLKNNKLNNYIRKHLWPLLKSNLVNKYVASTESKEKNIINAYKIFLHWIAKNSPKELRNTLKKEEICEKINENSYQEKVLAYVAITLDFIKEKNLFYNKKIHNKYFKDIVNDLAKADTKLQGSIKDAFINHFNKIKNYKDVRTIKYALKFPVNAMPEYCKKSIKDKITEIKDSDSEQFVECVKLFIKNSVNKYLKKARYISLDRKKDAKVLLQKLVNKSKIDDLFKTINNTIKQTLDKDVKENRKWYRRSIYPKRRLNSRFRNMLDKLKTWMLKQLTNEQLKKLKYTDLIKSEINLLKEKNKLNRDKESREKLDKILKPKEGQDEIDHNKVLISLKKEGLGKTKAYSNLWVLIEKKKLSGLIRNKSGSKKYDDKKIEIIEARDKEKNEDRKKKDILEEAKKFKEKVKSLQKKVDKKIARKTIYKEKHVKFPGKKPCDPGYKSENDKNNLFYMKK